ncbi:hypothetical protein A8C56_19750 [Niabella ginsenosidivorans]|uniref:Uncharacterized protein n=1 Tax=Niabella ginsenosidivorans TaxID=1176587 RepID=A0A1A9I8C3_9BACT|nr:hypothetical protein [Niabella ginsenosidivorans]ANH82921.1 hypothetical protein A8C56_19750 [Niabella ginsenosidivorans]
MKKVLLLLLTIALAKISYNQDVVYTVNNWNSTQITQYTGINPSTGTYTGSTTKFGDVSSSAMGMNTAGYLYYIPVSTNTGDFEVYSTATPSAGNPYPSATEVLSADMNGSSDEEIYFRRLGIRADGWAYMVLSGATGNIYMARFKTYPDGSASDFENLGTITLDDGSAGSEFNNGDLVFDETGNMFIMVNQDTGGGTTKLYMITPAALNAATGPASVTQAAFKWNVKDADGDNFGQAVTGLAMSSTGGFYLSAQGGAGSSDAGLFYLDPTTANATTKEVNVTKLISTEPGMADVATNYYASTILPVSFGSISASITGNQLQVNWTTETETNNDHFEIWVSQDGKTFAKAGEVASKASNGTSTQSIAYSYSTPAGKAVSLLGLSIFALGLMTLFFTKKNKALLVFIAFAGLGVTSCSKHSEQIDTTGNGKLFVKIIQVDKDGKQSSSKVVTAYKAD